MLSACIHLAICKLSFRFAVEVPPVEHPILAALGWFALAFGIYLAALQLALRIPPTCQTTGLIIGFAIVFRVIAWWSEPILELDLYRYLWDGRVTSIGISPFQFAPQQVFDSTLSELRYFERTLDVPKVSISPAKSINPLQEIDITSGNQNFGRLTALARTESNVRKILNLVQYPELTTVYPPVSQAVFCITTLLTPTAASVETSIRLLKLGVLTFDLGTILILLMLLRCLNYSTGWLVAYAWCPLVIKEFANSAHIDSVAVFLTTLSLFCTVRAIQTTRTESNVTEQSSSQSWIWWPAATLCLAMAVGAKLYPVILTPLLFCSMLRRTGWKMTITTFLLFTAVVLALVAPLILSSPSTPTIASHVPIDSKNPDAVPGPFGKSPHELMRPTLQTASSGLTSFLRQWEINDFLFLVLVENCRPENYTHDDSHPWFVIVPDSVRRHGVTLGAWLVPNFPRKDIPFLLARSITLSLFFGLALYFAWRGSRTTSPTEFLEQAFLTISWFWLLAPTQNPWYWTWSLPLISFTRNRVWLGMSGLVLLSYLRFWFVSHEFHCDWFSWHYSGATVFDFVIVWFEYTPWFILLFLTWRRRVHIRKVSIMSTNPPPHPGIRVMTVRRQVLVGFITIAVAIVGWLIFGPSDVKVLGKHWTSNDQISMDAINHVKFDRLLRTYVNTVGLVNYSKWKSSPADLQELNDYLVQLGQASQSKLCHPQARLAYWINAYNAVTLAGILEVYPTTSIRQHTAGLMGFNFWDDLHLCVGKTTISLNQIEHDLLRTLGEPRIHFAIVCASLGCPRLRNEAYFAEMLDEQLSDNAVDFFSRPQNLRYDATTQTLFLSSLVKWFGSDFGATAKDQLRFLMTYFPEEIQSIYQNEDSPLLDLNYDWLEYDWNLNDQK